MESLRRKFTSYFLKSLRPLFRPRINHTIFNNLKELGILRNTRTSRGGKMTQMYLASREKATSRIQYCIPTIPITTTQRLSKFHLKTNKENLIQISANRWDLPNFMTANTRSLLSKIDEFEGYLKVNNVDVAGVSESWLNDNITDSMINIPGFTHARNDRKERRGGGVICYVKNHLPHKVWTELCCEDIESIWITLRPPKLPRSITRIITSTIYHPPQSLKQEDSQMNNHITSCLDFLLKKYPQSGIVLMGDFNHLPDKYLKQQFGLRQVVANPTRGRAILDKIYTNLSDFYSTPQVGPELAGSDHKTIMYSPSTNCGQLKGKIQYISKRMMSSNRKALFAEALKSVAWEPLFKLFSCKLQFEFFSEIMQDLLNTFFPIKSVKVCSTDKPWITDKFKDLINLRQKYYLSGNLTEYRKCRNKINRLSSKLRSTYYENHLIKLKDGNTKDWWGSMKCLMGNTKQNTITPLQNMADNICDGNIHLLACKVNAFFTSVSQNLQPLKTSHGYCQDSIPDKYIISVKDVESRLSSLRVGKASGPDNLPTWILKDFAPVLSRPICSIFNSSVRDGYLPSVWKAADVCPIPKGVKPRKIESDLRPISLTSILSKELEHYIFKWTWESVKNQIDLKQYGSMKGSSTTHALVEMFHNWLKGLETPKTFARILFLDYSKAFDHIDHNILIQKLVTLQVPQVIIRWIQSFLSVRKQRVKIGDIYSEWSSPNGGVPQGTKLGPLLFIIMINDLRPSCDSFKYVDDTTMSKISSNPTDNTIQNSAQEVQIWSQENNLKLNGSKTKEMIIQFSKSQQLIPAVTINGTVVERVDVFKLLGLYVTNDLKWNVHIEQLVKKASKRLFFLRELIKANTTKKDLRLIYIAIIRPVLEYACPVWHTSLPTYLSDIIETVQKRALRIICPQLHYNEALAILNLQLLSDRRTELCKSFFKKICSENDKIYHLLPEPKQHSYNLRNTKNLPTLRCRTERYKTSFVPWALTYYQ